MRKKIIIILVIIAAMLLYEFRNELMFSFQYARLKGLACQEKEPDFMGDSCLNKIWPHRVNSPERFQKLQGKFGGYETDIVWDGKSKRFLVYHPPLEEEPITLDSFFNSVEDDNEMFWLDTREVGITDTANVLAEFKRLEAIHHIKMNCIIEVYDTAVANFLANKAYWVTLNIQTEWVQKFSRESQWEQLRNSMSPMISFVSQEDTHVPLLKKHFPGKDIITWSTSFDNYFDRKHLRELVNDNKVKVVLVNIKSRYYK